MWNVNRTFRWSHRFRIIKVQQIICVVWSSIPFSLTHANEFFLNEILFNLQFNSFYSPLLALNTIFISYFHRFRWIKQFSSLSAKFSLKISLKSVSVLFLSLQKKFHEKRPFQDFNFFNEIFKQILFTIVLSNQLII